MIENKTNNIIYYGVLCIIGYYIVQAFIRYIILGVVGLVVWQVFKNFHKHK